MTEFLDILGILWTQQQNKTSRRKSEHSEGLMIKCVRARPFNPAVWLVLLLLGLQVIDIGSAAAQELGSAEQGYQLAIQICAECHSVEKGNYFSLNKNAPPFEAIANTPGMGAMALNVFFKTPHRTMPNFKFDEEDTADLISYILSLKSDN